MTWRIPGRNITIADAVLAIVALGIATFLIFQNLSAPAIRIWDEAIYADNAIDMYTYGDPIVMKRNGELTLYNTKPPLVIWLQTLSMHVFGVNEFAIRFPSALAGVLTCIMLLLFSLVTLKDIRIGIVGVLVLSTSYGFVRQHVVKTGDLDAVLVFWTTFYSLLALHILLAESLGKTKLILWVGVGIVAAFLTKGIAGFIPVAGLGVCVVVMRKVKWALSRRNTYVALAGIFLVFAGYYILREYLSSGFLRRTLQVDFGRYTTDYMSWHHHPWYYYFQNLYSLEFFTPYVFWLVIAVVIGLLSVKYRKPVLLLTIQALVFIGVLSYPKVKLMWYDAPVYPLLALLCAIGFATLWNIVDRQLRMRRGMRDGLFVTSLLLLFALPVSDMYERNASLYLPVDVLEREGFFLRELKNSQNNIRHFNVLMHAQQNAHYTQVDFYLNAYNRYAGYDITLVRDTSEVHVGDIVACCQEEQITWMRQHFKLEILSNNEIGCVLVKIGKAKAAEEN